MAPLGVPCPHHGKQGRSSAHQASLFCQRSVRNGSCSSGNACYRVLSTTVKLLDKIAPSNRSCCGASLPCFHSFGSFSTLCTTLSELYVEVLNFAPYLCSSMITENDIPISCLGGRRQIGSASISIEDCVPCEHDGLFGFPCDKSFEVAQVPYPEPLPMHRSLHFAYCSQIIHSYPEQIDHSFSASRHLLLKIIEDPPIKFPRRSR